MLTFFIFLYSFEKGMQADNIGSVRVRELSDNLIKLGHKVILFIAKKRHPHRPPNMNIKIVEIPFLTRGFLRPLSFYFLLFVISFLYAFRFRPDVIYVRTMGTFLPVIVSKLFSTPLVIEVNGDTLAGQKNRLKLALLKFTDRINFRFCDKIIPITNGLQEMLEQRYKVPPAKTTVISSGSNISLFRPLDTGECRKLLKLQPDSYYVGFIGTLYNYQGIDTLIEAAPSVLNRFPHTKFLIVGEGPMKNAWIQRTKDKGLSGFFIFTGQVPYERVPYYVNAMDVCVAPFLSNVGNVCPVKIFDYFACGRPIVVSDICSVHKILSASGGVILVPSEEPKELAQAIARLLGNKAERDRLGGNGRSFVVKKYNWENLTKKTVQVCRDARTHIRQSNKKYAI